MKFQLVSITGLKFDDEAYEVILPTSAGTIAIFANHMPLMSTGIAGVISVRKKSGDSDDNLEHFATSGGLIQTDGKDVTFLADDVVQADEVTEEEAAAAIREAEKLIKNSSSQIELHEARQMLQRSSARLEVARLKKRHHR